MQGPGRAPADLLLGVHVVPSSETQHPAFHRQRQDERLGRERKVPRRSRSGASRGLRQPPGPCRLRSPSAAPQDTSLQVTTIRLGRWLSTQGRAAGVPFKLVLSSKEPEIWLFFSLQPHLETKGSSVTPLRRKLGRYHQKKAPVPDLPVV